MAIDASIALGVKPVQIESPLNQMANVYALQNAQQTNQLNQMKMEEYKRGIANTERRNALLGGFTPDMSVDQQVNALARGGFLDEAKALAESAAKVGKEKRESEKALTDIEAAHIKTMREYLPMVNNQATYDAWRTETAKRLPNYANLFPAQYTPGLNQTLALSADKALENHFVNQENVMVNGVPTSRVLQVPKYGTGAATPVAGSIGATYNKPAASTVVNVDMAQEKEFEKALGKGQADKVLTSKASAEDAAQILATNKVAKDLLDKGMITGTGADFFVGLNKALNKAGIDFGGADAAANSQAYGGLMATNTAKIIKNFGAGTGLSDADRAYALKAAAGDINMDEKAIRRLIDINSRAAQNVIKLHNKNVSGIKTNIPLTVNPEDFNAGIPEGRAGTTAGATGTRKPLKDIFK
jgi:hypothetical protein